MKYSTRVYLLIFVALLAFLLPFALVMQKIITGDINFWYDPARDFLLASENLQKLTLIGPTSGIPGIFYGPFWIWLLSFGLLFSQDPRVVIFVSLTLPYFVFLPIILWKFRKNFGFTAIIIMWLVFMLTAGTSYALNPWNPHPAPLLFIILIYIIVNTDFLKKGRGKFWRTLVIGGVSGLILNFHISFGIGTSVGTFLFLIFYNGYFFVKHKISLKHFVLLTSCYIAGVVIAFLPFLLFEFRHGFNQIQTAIKVFTAKGSVVNVTGLTDAMIIEQFTSKLADLLKIPMLLAVGIFSAASGYLVLQIRSKKLQLEPFDYKLLILLLSVSMSILVLYITSKNPVWSYHFIGVEVIFMFLIGYLCSKNKVLAIFLAGWIILSTGFQMQTRVSSLTSDPMKNSTLTTKKHIVTLIQQDAKNTPYTFFAYSPSVYIYEYTYLFKWLANKDVPYDPSNSPQDSPIVYIVTPSSDDKKVEDFINYRTPNSVYSTAKRWNISDGSIVMKRVKIDVPN